MGELRDRMVRDMDVRHFSGRTVEAYLAGVKGLAKYYMRAPDQLSDAEVQPYLLYIREERYNHYVGKHRWEQRYGAVLLAPSGDPRWVPLGSAAALETKTRRYQKAVREQVSETQLTEILQALYQQIWAPVDAALPPGTRTVILSPDAELNFVSFATMLTPEDQFLGAKYSLRYVASGRDLLREVPPPPLVPQMTVYANPDFAGRRQAPSSNSVGSHLALRALEIRDLQGLYLPQLPGTHREAAALETEARQWKWGVERFEDSQATETRLRAARSPWVLHLATHGFFLEESGADKTEGITDPRGVGGVHLLSSKGLHIPSEAEQAFRLKPNTDSD